MKLNPIYRRDELTGTRSLSLPLLITLLNAGLSILVLINLFYVTADASVTGEISYGNFLRIYYYAAGIEYFALLMMAPVLTASSITLEKERKTLGLLLTSQLSPREIIRGKLFSALSLLFETFVTALPILATVSIFGGVTWLELLVAVLVTAVSLFYASSVGILTSARLHTTTSATAAAYIAVLGSMAVLFLGLYAARFLPAYAAWVLPGELMLMVVLSFVFLEIAERSLLPRRRHVAVHAAPPDESEPEDTEPEATTARASKK